MITGNASVVGLLGWPVSHSLSPKLHQHWIAYYGLDALYAPFPVAPEHLGKVVSSLADMGMRGCNITIPHKEAILPFVNHIHESARTIGAINTLVIDEDKHITGYNTDGFGFIENIRLHCPKFHNYNSYVLVLGAGGAAPAILHALKEEGISSVYVANRTMSKAQALAERAEANVQEWEHLEKAFAQASWIINTTSIGMKGTAEQPLPLHAIGKEVLVCDIVYRPLMTPLLEYAEHHGNRYVSGIGMLAFQAAKSFELWFGIRPYIDERLLADMAEWAQEK